MTYVETESCENAEAAKAWPAITEKKSTPSDAKRWVQVKDKRNLLELA